MNKDIQYLTEIEVSRMTRIAVQTLRNNRFRRRGIPYRKVGRSIRYRLDEVVDFMEARKIHYEER